MTHAMAGDTPTIPLGVPGLDRYLGGGVDPGTAVLAIGPFGSGHREFLRTAAVIHGNWQAESGLFDAVYDQPVESLHRPAGVQYLSVVESAARVRAGLAYIADADWVAPAVDHVSYTDFAEDFASLGIVKPSQAGGFEYKEAVDENVTEFRYFFRHFGDILAENVSDQVLLLDAISDFLPIAYKYLDWPDLYFITQTMTHLIGATDSVLLACADADILRQREQALLKRTFDNVLDFSELDEGTQRGRAMTVTKFPRFWRETDFEHPVQFDVELDRGDFGIAAIETADSSR